MHLKVTRLFLWLHKWIGIGMGVIVLVWLVSGMVMILPFTPLVPRRAAERIDMRQAALSPAAAIDLVGTREGSTSGVRRFEVVAVGADPYYRIDTNDGRAFLLSAATGERLVVDRDVAERIARRDFSTSVPVRSAVEVSRHSFGYPGGALPAWRVEFDDARGTIAYVSVLDGSVVHGDLRSRVRAFVSGLHTFDQIEQLGGSEQTKKLSLHLTSVVTIVLVLTGYYVVLPRRWRRRWELAGHPRTTASAGPPAT